MWEGVHAVESEYRRMKAALISAANDVIFISAGAVWVILMTTRGGTNHVPSFRLRTAQT